MPEFQNNKKMIGAWIWFDIALGYGNKNFKNNNVQLWIYK